MNRFSEKYRLLALLAVLVGGWGAWYAGQRFFGPAAKGRTESTDVDPDSAAGQAAPIRLEPLPPVTASRFLNTRPPATFVAADACAECHQDEDESYRRTAHSRSLGDVDIAAEPPDATFDDPRSARLYHVYRRANQLHHRESVRLPDGETIELGDFPLRYVVGSGAHARTYLVEIDGFLAESPVTWYASRQAWGLSPGYEVFNAGFARPVGYDCLFCHAGRVASIDGNSSRPAIHSMAIDCQRCHGPGSLHVQQWTTGGDLAGDADLTIVNPSRLTREANEAICAQCHFHSDAEVDVRGRDIGDFRPGQSLHDYRAHFALQTANKSMVVTGHGEQMHLSRCYQQSETLTCTTCHDPHAKPTDQDKLRFYRDKCLACHTDKACGLAPEARRVKSPQDDCVACHMPGSATEVRHVAATHHRIGIHEALPMPAEKPQGTLVAVDDLSHLPKIEQDRCLGVAYLNLAVQTRDPQVSETYRRQAQEILERVRGQGLREPVMEVALAKTYQAGDPRKTIELARSALQFENVTGDIRVEALFALSNAYLRMKQLDRAIEAFEQLVELRRRGEDWFLLGVIRYQAGDVNGALDAVRRAIAIRPDLPNFHGLLAELYQRDGQGQLAAEHRRLAEQFSRLGGGRP